MRKLDAEDRIKAINKTLILVVVIDSFGGMLLGLALAAKFSTGVRAMLPFLNQESNLGLLLGTGVVLSAWGTYRLVALVLEKGRLINEYDLSS